MSNAVWLLPNNGTLRVTHVKRGVFVTVLSVLENELTEGLKFIRFNTDGEGYIVYNDLNYLMGDCHGYYTALNQHTHFLKHFDVQGDEE